MNSNCGAVIFDLDGTLLDTLEDLTDAANRALRSKGFSPHPCEAFRLFVGNGMTTLMRRALPPDTSEEVVLALAEVMREEYSRNWAEKTRPYPGIATMLGALSGKALPLAVLSNKPHDFTVAMVQHFFPDIAFTRVQGLKKDCKAKPDPSSALDIASGFGLDPGEILFLGDSSVDMDTASAAGMIPVGALWGFRTKEELEAHGAKLLLERPELLLDYT